jgi:hypothetical protein
VELKFIAGADNIEASAPNDTERKKKKENNNVEGIDRTVSGYRSGLAQIRMGGSGWHRVKKKIRSHKKMSRTEPSEEKQR